ncbi:MAG: phosphatidate cytidylyltransferase [Pseudomonadota bacterium]|nr:phosphatidate cytidylyltransferase [Pseudomonadota bacterium]
MLRQRILTAVLLLALLIPVLVIRDPRPLAILSLLAMAAAGWEWARLNDAGKLAPALGIGLGVLCAATMALGWSMAVPHLVWWLALVAWILGGAAILRAGVAGWPRLPRVVRWAIGFAALWTAWLALSEAKSIGLNFIVSILAIVWAADITAYFGGRAFGRRKLAPAISPGKSWEGVWSGMLGALVVAALWLLADARLDLGSASIFTVIARRYSFVGVALVVVFLVAASVVGDLLESLVKRSAGAKDSSGLLPGHGGVLDRLDALLPVMPIALALAHG